MPDSLLHIADSLKLLSADSIAGRDSLVSALPPHHTDSLPLLQPLPNGMEGIDLPAHPSNEPWVFAVIMGLFLLLSVGASGLFGTLVHSFRSFFSHKDTMSGTSSTFIGMAQHQLIMLIFTISVLALGMYEFIFIPASECSFTAYAVLCGAVAGYFFLKNILFEIIGNTFFDSKTTKGYKALYFNLMHASALLFFPIIVLYTYQPTTWLHPLRAAMATVGMLLSITLIIKLLQIFYTKPLALFYIFLYLCTLEILPLLILFRVSERLL